MDGLFIERAALMLSAVLFCFFTEVYSMQNYLIVVDMQTDFVDGALGTKEAQAIVPAVKKRIEEAL